MFNPKTGNVEHKVNTMSTGDLAKLVEKDSFCQRMKIKSNVEKGPVTQTSNQEEEEEMAKVDDGLDLEAEKHESLEDDGNWSLLRMITEYYSYNTNENCYYR